MGRWHAHASVRAGGRLTAVVDPDTGAAQSLARSYPTARAVASLDEALADTAGGVVHICTPADSHAELAERALEGGAHVLVEKPLTPHLATTERILELAEGRGLLACPCHQYVFQRGTAIARESLDAIGPLVHAEAVACSAGGRGRPRSDLDQIALEIVPHALSVLQHLLPADVGAAGWRTLRPREGELRAESLLEGLPVSLVVSMNGRPPRNELRLIGMRGTIRVDFFHGFATVQRARVSRIQKLAEPFRASVSTASAAAINLGIRAAMREPAYPGLRALIGRLYLAVQDRSLPPIPGEDSLAVARAWQRMSETLDQ